MLWTGRFSKEISGITNDFNSSLPFDKRLYKEDITGSIAHVTMLGDCGIIEKDEAGSIAKELTKILDDMESGALTIADAEDIHSFVEQELTKRLGELGKKLHTARSRNDQVAVDLRLYLRREMDEIGGLLKGLIQVLCDLAQEHTDTIMPGYTHLQRAQPITFAQHIMAYSQMFLRDFKRLMNCFELSDECPLGSGALAGTTHPIDRQQTAKMLGFRKPCANSLDGVSDRDYCVEFSCDLSLIMVHLSRFAEEIILWASSEFKFIELDDAFATGSSIMPQKKNPDIAELVRGKSGRVFGNLQSLLVMLKGLPLAYNKDMQEDKEVIFDSVDTVKMCLKTFTPMLETMQIRKDNMLSACKKGFINATDLADYLTKKGVPFRDAYKIVGEIVACAIEKNWTLEEISLDEYKKFSDQFGSDVYQAISLETCVKERKSDGASCTVKQQIDEIREYIIGNASSK